MVWTAGHAVSDGVNDADVVLADGVARGAGQPPSRSAETTPLNPAFWHAAHHSNRRFAARF